MKNASIDDVDRTLSLPDHLVHQILSSLPLKDAVRTSLLSRRWKNMWITALPILQFDFYCFDDGDNDKKCSKTKIKRVDLLNFVERMLRLLHSHSRNGNRNVSTQKMELNFPVYSSEVATTLDRCIRYAIGCNVKELNLYINFLQGGLYNLSHTVFTAKSLTQLRLNGCKLEFSSCVNMNFSSLKELSFLHVSVDDQILQNLIANCPLIEDLKLFLSGESNRILKISGLVNPKLVNLEILNGKFERLEISSRCLKDLKVIMCRRLFNIEIDVPNLSRFDYVGNNVIPFSSNSLALLKADISLYPTTVDTPWYVRLTEFLGKFNNSESLELMVCESTKSVVVPKDLRNSLLPPLYNVKHLSLSVVSGLPIAKVEEILDGMLWLSPHPKSLSIASNFKEVLSLKLHYMEMGKEEKCSCCSSLPFPCWRHCLKAFKISNFGENEDIERNVNNFFQEHAKIL